MDAFEQLVSEIYFRQGYWVQTSVKVALTKEEKRSIDRPSSPRWEIDVVAYSGGKNELLALECKSFLDSPGVALAEFQDGHSSTRYKLFREDHTRNVVLQRLQIDLEKAGYIPQNTNVRFGLIAGKIKNGDAIGLEKHFKQRDWLLRDADWIKTELKALAKQGYSNDVSAVVAKLLCR